jgi:hypothetical protein
VSILKWSEVNTLVVGLEVLSGEGSGSKFWSIFLGAREFPVCQFILDEFQTALHSMVVCRSGDRQEVSLTLKIPNRCEPNESSQTNIRKRSVCPVAQLPMGAPLDQSHRGGRSSS